MIYVIFRFIWLGPSGDNSLLDFLEDIFSKKYSAWIKPAYIMDDLEKRRSKRRTIDVEAQRIAGFFQGVCLFCTIALY